MELDVLEPNASLDVSRRLDMILHILTMASAVMLQFGPEMDWASENMINFCWWLYKKTRGVKQFDIVLMQAF